MIYKARQRRRFWQRPAPETLRGGIQTETDSNVPLLYLEQLPNLTHGLTPARLRHILADAEQGNIMEQHTLFADMEDRCEHLACEIGKRKRALLTLDWDIIPGSDDAKARKIAEQVRAMVDMLPSVEDMIMDLADAIGHGFAALEIQWGLENGWHIPTALVFRPQSWFQCLWTDRNQLRLRDGSACGAELWPCGWIVHTHKSKSGWLPRSGLFRVVAWAYLIRAYALNANIAYTQIHGLPLRLGKYPPGSTEEDKKALLHALRCLGQDAAGIIPAGMEVLFQTPTTTTQDIPGMLVTRCEQGMSKAILGGTLTTQADGKTSTNALGTVHNEVRRDLLVADAMQLASTLSQQLLAPLCMLNLGVTDRKLLPWWRFDTQEAGDLALYADALPKLAPYMKISRKFVHERLKLPEALEEEDIFRDETSGDDEPDAPGSQTPRKRQNEDGEPASLTVAANSTATGDDKDELDRMCDSANAAMADAATALLAPLFSEVQAGLSPEELEERLAELYPAMDAEQLTDILSRLFFVAQLWGRTDAGQQY